jgi:YVTN family beta-propeller protein
LVIDRHTDETLAHGSVGTNPWIIEVSETANRIYVASHDGQSVSVIDSHSNEVLYTIDVGVSPVFVAVNEATGRVYVASSGDDTVSVLDSLILE